MKNTTFNLPPDLIARAKAYAAENGTSMTAIVREHLEAVAGDGNDEAPADPLLAYANGSMSRSDAIEALGLRDYAELLVALGEQGLAPPRPAPHDIENQAAVFERIWKSAS